MPVRKAQARWEGVETRRLAPTALGCGEAEVQTTNVSCGAGENQSEQENPLGVSPWGGSSSAPNYVHNFHLYLIPKDAMLNIGKKILSVITVAFTILGSALAAWQYFNSAGAELTADVYSYPHFSYGGNIVQGYLDGLEKILDQDDGKYREERYANYKYAKSKLDFLNNENRIDGIVEIDLQNNGEKIARDIEVFVEGAVFYDYKNDKYKKLNRVFGSVLKINEIRQGDVFKIISWVPYYRTAYLIKEFHGIRINFPSGEANFVYHHDVPGYLRFIDENLAIILIFILLSPFILSAIFVSINEIIKIANSVK